LARGLASGSGDTSNGAAGGARQAGSLQGGGATQLNSGVLAAGYNTNAVGYDGLPLGGRVAAEGDLYGTGAVPDWTGKPGSDVLGDAR